MTMSVSMLMTMSAYDSNTRFKIYDFLLPAVDRHCGRVLHAWNPIRRLARHHHGTRPTAFAVTRAQSSFYMVSWFRFS